MEVNQGIQCLIPHYVLIPEPQRHMDLRLPVPTIDLTLAASLTGQT